MIYEGSLISLENKIGKFSIKSLFKFSWAPPIAKFFISDCWFKSLKYKYEVLKPFHILEEEIAPAFGQPGGGKQIRAKIPEVSGYATVEDLKYYEYLGDTKWLLI